MLSKDEEQQGQTEGLQTSVPSGAGVPQGDGLPLASPTMTPKLPKLVLKKFNGDITKFRTFWIDLIARLIKTLTFHL